MNQTANQAALAGTPDPLDFRRHRRVEEDRQNNPSGFAEGGALSVAGGAVSKLIPVAGALAVTFRGLFAASAGGTFTFAYVRPDSAAGTSYGVSNPANVVVSGGTEFCFTINPNGEGNLLVTFTPSGTGTITFFDTMQQ